MKGSPSRPNSPILTLQMTDEDVVARVAILLNTTYRLTKNRNPEKWKDCYSLRINGRRAALVMRLLLPHMSIRRRQQINAALACLDPQDNRTLRALDHQMILTLKNQGLRVVEIADKLGCRRESVYRILRLYK